MLVYHGTTLEIREALIIESDKGRDFGSALKTLTFVDSYCC